MPLKAVDSHRRFQSQETQTVLEHNQKRVLDLTAKRRFRSAWLLLCFTLLGFAVMGYHPGLEDDGLYLSAVKMDLNPALYPHDAEFFRIQLEASYFDKIMASAVRLTGMPVAVMELAGQLAAIAIVVFACWRIACSLFDEERARWAGTAMVAAMFTLPVAGTGLFLLDQHLHARNAATALILLAVWRVLEDRRWQAAPLLAIALLIHPIMAAAGVCFCFFLGACLSEPVRLWVSSWHRAPSAASLAAAVPLGWIFESPNPLWKKALDTRTYYYLYKWTWYEWLGALAPIFLFWLLWRVASKHGQTRLARFSLAVFVYAAVCQAIAMTLLAVPSLIRLTPLQPMRYLQIVYFFMALIAGCLAGKYLLKGSVWRWAVFLVIFNGAMFVAQRLEFGNSAHIEWPGSAPANPWLQAFAWIRTNTPTDAYFALDPRYLALPKEDYHSFRALAERSQLADAIKDSAVVTQVPELGPLWNTQVEAQQGWKSFGLQDFERLRNQFGVTWVLVRYPWPAGLDCRWHNQSLSVCEVPEKNSNDQNVNDSGPNSNLRFAE